MKVIAIILLAVIVLLVFSGWSLSPAATAGVQINHNGKPLDNLEVRIYLPWYINSGSPSKTLTTDGTGIVTVTNSHGDLWNGGSILYDFTYNGTTYSFSGPDNQIIVESV